MASLETRASRGGEKASRRRTAAARLDSPRRLLFTCRKFSGLPVCPSENVNAHGRRRRTLLARHGSPGDTRYEKRVATQQDRSSTRGTPSSSLAKVGNPLGGVSYCLASLALSTLSSVPPSSSSSPHRARHLFLPRLLPSTLRSSFVFVAASSSPRFHLRRHPRAPRLLLPFLPGSFPLLRAAAEERKSEDWRRERERRKQGCAPRRSWRALVNCN